MRQTGLAFAYYQNWANWLGIYFVKLLKGRLALNSDIAWLCIQMLLKLGKKALPSYTVEIKGTLVWQSHIAEMRETGFAFRYCRNEADWLCIQILPK